MPSTQNGKFAALLTVLQQSGADFILVGGLAAVLQGAPVQTFDVDILYSRDSKNVERLLGVLHSLDAIFRSQPERREPASLQCRVGREPVRSR